MQRNTDDQQVVLDRNMYDKLLHLARIGASESNNKYSLDQVQRHARKFNTRLMTEAYNQREQLHVSRREMIFQTRAFLKANRGKIVYHRSGQNRLCPMLLVGSGMAGKHSLRVIDWSDKPADAKLARKSFDPVREVFFTALTTELPEEWVVLQRGVWKGHYAPYKDARLIESAPSSFSRPLTASSK